MMNAMRLMHLWGSVLLAGLIALGWTWRDSNPSNHAPAGPPSTMMVFNGGSPVMVPARPPSAPVMPTSQRSVVVGVDAGVPPMGVWGTQPEQPDDVYRTLQEQAERATLTWAARAGLLGVNLLVTPTGIRHDMTWCQLGWDRRGENVVADGYGSTPQAACHAMEHQAVQNDPALARQVVLHGLVLP